MGYRNLFFLESLRLLHLTQSANPALYRVPQFLGLCPVTPRDHTSRVNYRNELVEEYWERRAFLDARAKASAEGGCWGTVLAVQRERLVSPDLYLLDSPAGAIHRRGKAELHLVASG